MQVYGSIPPVALQVPNDHSNFYQSITQSIKISINLTSNIPVCFVNS